MKPEEQTVLLIKGLMAELSAAEREQCEDLADHIRRAVEIAGPTVGTLALALVGAEAQLKASK